MNNKFILAGILCVTVLVGSWATSLSDQDVLLYEAHGQAKSEALAPSQTEGSSSAVDKDLNKISDKAVDKPTYKVQQAVEEVKKEIAIVATKPETKLPEIQSSRSQGTPRVTGSAAFIQSVNKALAILDEKAPNDARKVAYYLKEIRESDHSGVIVQTGVFYLGRNTVTGQDTYWLASVIVHDAYHVELYQNGQDYAGKEAEAQCIIVQKKALKTMGAADSYQTHLDKILESNYWEVPFENRNW